MTTYRDFTITFNPPSIATNAADYQFVHKDYDGPGDNRCGHAPTLEAAKEAIDEIIAEMNSIPEWGRYMSPAEQYQEAMDELMAEYDRYDGLRMDFNEDNFRDEYDEVEYTPAPPVTPPITRIDDSEIPF